MQENGGFAIPYADDASILGTPLTVGMHSIPNRIAIQPMEGCDGTADGSPGEATTARYHSFAESGAGLIWFEATAAVHEGRANPRQLMLCEHNADEFARLIADIRELSRSSRGIEPVIIMQLTHSGRYSKPDGKPAPVIARHNPLFEGDKPLAEDCIVTDEGLMRLEEDFARATVLAARAGFDGIDIKACHGYLINELFAAFTREGPYGGCFENRTRFFKNCVTAARAAAPRGFLVTSRMNIYDAYPVPYGFGVKDGGGTEPDLTEPVELLTWMRPELINITMGNPYQNPQVNRPVETAAVARMLGLTAELTSALPQTAVIGSGLTYLRERAGQAAAGAIERGMIDMAGFGRLAFAYKGFATDMLAGRFDKKKACVTCGGCSKLMRAGSITGCVVRDAEYARLFKQHVEVQAR